MMQAGHKFCKTLCFSPPPLPLILSPGSLSSELMDNRRRRQLAKITGHDSEEVNSIEWEIINMTEEEEDLIYRMYRLIGDRWDWIAGRIPGRKPEEIERFWIMRHGEGFAEKGISGRKNQQKNT